MTKSKRVKILDFIISGCILYIKISRIVIFGLVFLVCYNDKKESFKDLLEKDGSVSIHHRNLRTFAVE